MPEPGWRKASGSPANKPLTRIHIFCAGKPSVTFQYVGLTSRSTGEKAEFEVTFVGPKH